MDRQTKRELYKILKNTLYNTLYKLATNKNIDASIIK